MNLEEFTEKINAFWDEGDEKNAALLAGEHPDLYAEYARIWIGEEDEASIDGQA
jgi:hypothetical protein